jgi:hypothetical protein
VIHPLLRRLGAGTASTLAVALWPALSAANACQPVNYSCEAQSSDVVARAGAATVMLRFPGASQCTGTLLNNARGDGRPFILTARHCAIDGDLDALAGGVEILYGHELGCDGKPVGTPVSTVGAIHRAVYQDAWLIEALDPPPASVEAYFAGFNATDRYGTDYFGVHHGNGHAKQFVEQRVESGNLLYLVSGTLAWVASTWHTGLLRGSTPFGSSGSALFDTQGRVFGVLSGGAICAGDAKGNDYQQLSAAWTGDGDAGSSLRPWLDPDQSGAKTISGRSVDDDSTPAAPAGEPAADAEAGGGGGGALSTLMLGVLLAALGARRRSLKTPSRS